MPSTYYVYCHRFRKDTNESRITYRIQWGLRDLSTNETLFGFARERSFYAKETKQRRWVAEVLRYVRREIKHKLSTHYAKLYESPSYRQPRWPQPQAILPEPQFLPDYFDYTAN
jgi:hypothetical protein